MRQLRGAGAFPLVMAGVAAAALTGAAVFTVASAGCDQPGYYVQSGGHTQLVGGCLRPSDLPDAPADRGVAARPAALPGGSVQP